MKRFLAVCYAMSLACATHCCIAADADPFGADASDQTLAEKRREHARDIQAAPSATAAPVKRKQPVQQSDDHVYAALKEPTVFEFVEQPLQEVVDHIKEKHQLEIQFDKHALEEGGVGTDTAITRNLHGVTLDAALRLLLPDLDLTYVVRDGVLLITTPEAALRMGDTRVYDVKLLADGQNPAVLASLVEQTLLYRRACALKQLASPPAKQPGSKSDENPPAPTVRALGTVLVVNASCPEQKLVRDFLDELTSSSVPRGQASR